MRTGRIRGKLTYANVMATVAMFAALGGGAYAVSKNSVGSKHIKNGSVKSKDIKDNGIKGKDVKNDTLTGADIDESKLAAVPFAAETYIRAEHSNGEAINVAGDNSNQTVQTVTIDAPVTGTLLIRGGLRPDNEIGEDIYSCDLIVDGGPIGASSRGSVVSNNTGANDDNSCETSAGVDVPEGEHTVGLRAIGVAVGNEIEDASLQALFVPHE